MLLQSPLLALILAISLLFPSLSHPLSMGLTLLMLVLAVALLLGTLATNLWLSYILVLILLGGLLVIFVYVSLLSSNELFSHKSSGIIIILTILSTLGVGVLSLGEGESHLSEESLNPLLSQAWEGIEWLSSLYNSDLSFLTLFLILYLLVTLIVVVVITKGSRLSLRSRL